MRLKLAGDFNARILDIGTARRLVAQLLRVMSIEPRERSMNELDLHVILSAAPYSARFFATPFQAFAASGQQVVTETATCRRALVRNPRD